MLSQQQETQLIDILVESTELLLERRSRLKRLLQTSAATFESRERIEGYLVQIDFLIMERERERVQEELAPGQWW